MELTPAQYAIYDEAVLRELNSHYDVEVRGHRLSLIVMLTRAFMECFLSSAARSALQHIASPSSHSDLGPTRGSLSHRPLPPSAERHRSPCKTDRETWR